MSEESTFHIFEEQDDQKCGEKCDRKADVEVNGLIYCAPCLARLLDLGSLFQEAMENANSIGVRP